MTEFANAIDRESAPEILQRKIAESTEAAPPAEGPRQEAPRGRGRAAEPKSMVEEVLSSRAMQNAARQAARTVTQQVVRGLFGMLRGR
jgi:hypothetical protein